jgi:hypothetical protein
MNIRFELVEAGDKTSVGRHWELLASYKGGDWTKVAEFYTRPSDRDLYIVRWAVIEGIRLADMGDDGK